MERVSDNIEISDDDDSMHEIQEPVRKKEIECHNSILVSSDSDNDEQSSSVSLIQISEDDDDLPDISLNTRKAKAIRQLFPVKEPNVKVLETSVNFPSTSSSKTLTPSETSGVIKMIGGVPVYIPVEPYGCQVALMSKIIAAIKTKNNCLLESPTGTGKTLALLCGVLAWQRHERARTSQQLAKQHSKNYTALKNMDGAVEYVASVPNVNFQNPVYGERSIYDSPSKSNFNTERAESLGIDKGSGERSIYDSPSKSNFNTERAESLGIDKGSDSMVKIHDKRRRLCSTDSGSSSKPATPEKRTPPKIPGSSPQAETPETDRFLVNILRNWVTDDVNSSTPTIYYGARTHKQLKQVIKEFKRTSYCGEAKMTLLASRDYSCIREFDRKLWSSKNDMCRACVKTHSSGSKKESNCKYFDNRQALTHKTMPPGFDLEDLISFGERNNACPFYAARGMASSAHIVFCPYNYLIDPNIRSSMQIDLRNNIVVIDEAHNIEDICRDAASFSFTRDNVQAALSELEKLSGYLYSGQEISEQTQYIEKTLRTWNEWFANQLPLVNNQPVNNNESVFTWNSADFVQTLNYHNIGKSSHPEFKMKAEAFCRRLRDDPRVLLGVSQSTGNLIESLNMVLTYLFRCDGQFADDFKPALVRTLATDHMSEGISWRNSQFNKRIQKESLELRLMCMNPAIVFEGVKAARCVVLASGTLSPFLSLYSELDAQFPVRVTPNHVISGSQIWVGTLSTCPDGTRLECKSRDTSQAAVQDALGRAVLWVSSVTPHGVLCFMPSYLLMNQLAARWRETGLWRDLEKEKHIFMESRNVRDHNDIMEDFYKYVETERGAILFAVFRGKVSEGMDFRDHQARAVITIGIPYPSTYEMSIKEKMNYNNKYERTRNLLSSNEWLRVQAYRALNQAVGRCIRHLHDWGAVLMIDARFTNPYYTEHLSGWIRKFLNNNNHTFDSLVNSPNSLATFMKAKSLSEVGL